MFTTASRNTPPSNPSGRRGIACTKLKICTAIHRHRFVTPTVDSANLIQHTKVMVSYRDPGVFDNPECPDIIIIPPNCSKYQYHYILVFSSI
jgi:hypothetical protein